MTTKPPECKVWNSVKTARSEQRLRASDCIAAVFSEFEPLQGDRLRKDCGSVLAGIAWLSSRPVMVLGQEKGRNTRERLRCNFGMATPEGFRKAVRAMRLAEKFSLPVVSFIDTPGADASLRAENENQSKALSECLETMSRLKVPTLACVIGEGMSGGGLALSFSDRLVMLEHAIYSVISPEGCASILYKDSALASKVCAHMGISARQLYSMGLIDEVIAEEGVEHQNTVLERMSRCFSTMLEELCAMSVDKLLELRYAKWSLTDIKSLP